MTEARRIEIHLSRQQLLLLDSHGVLARYPVSTAANGAGEHRGSFCTPRGRHRIRALIGAGCPAGTVFVGRRPTGEIYSPDLARRYPHRDWILTRIIWLCGCEPGFNRFGDVDTQRRFIYIHGAPDHVAMGRPGSKGCIRMSNVAVIDLFRRCAAGMSVTILES